MKTNSTNFAKMHVKKVFTAITRMLAKYLIQTFCEFLSEPSRYEQEKTFLLISVDFCFAINIFGLCMIDHYNL